MNDFSCRFLPLFLFLMNFSAGPAFSEEESWKHIVLISPARPVGGLKCGAVRATFDIARDGKAENVTITSEFDAAYSEAAEEAILKWRFLPRRIEGEFIETRDVSTDIEFSCESQNISIAVSDGE